jgi:hypothetical protein
MNYVQKLVDVLERGNAYKSEFLNGKLYVVELKEEFGDNGIELNQYYCFTLPFENESDADEWFERISNSALEVSGQRAKMSSGEWLPLVGAMLRDEPYTITKEFVRDGKKVQQCYFGEQKFGYKVGGQWYTPDAFHEGGTPFLIN